MPADYASVVGGCTPVPLSFYCRVCSAQIYDKKRDHEATHCFALTEPGRKAKPIPRRGPFSPHQRSCPRRHHHPTRPAEVKSVSKFIRTAASSPSHLHRSTTLQASLLRRSAHSKKLRNAFCCSFVVPILPSLAVDHLIDIHGYPPPPPIRRVVGGLEIGSIAGSIRRYQFFSGGNNGKLLLRR